MKEGRLHKMNDSKVAFIICSNDEAVLSEAEYYLDRLEVPSGLSVEKIVIRDAVSMTSGYNRGMSKTDAKYKIYMHQDVFPVNRYIIRDLLEIFSGDRKLGILGVVGATQYIESGIYIDGWDFGALYSLLVFEPKLGSRCDEIYKRAVALDGLFLATQYDIPWREDLFDGWDYYDISQCFEFTRAGYRIGIANQDQDRPWCYHDANALSTLNYYHYKDIMAGEYSDLCEYKADPTKKEELILNKRDLIKQFSGQMRLLIDGGEQREQVISIIYENRKSIIGDKLLGDLKKIAIICHKEKNIQGEISFYKEGDSTEVLTGRLRTIRYAIKRTEYASDTKMMEGLLFDSGVSDCAVAISAVFFVGLWDDFMQNFADLFLKHSVPERFMAIQGLIKDYYDEVRAEGGRY